MKNIKQQFQEFKKTTPKHIQWLLLGVAFVIVIILLTLLLSHKNSNENSVSDANTSVDVNVDPQSISFNDVMVGESDNKNVNVSATTPVVVQSITTEEKNIKIIDNCTEGLIDSCTINVIYKPTSEHKKSNTTLKIVWHVESQPDILNTEEISVTYSALEPKIEEEPKPIVKEPEPIVEDEPEPIVEEEEPIEEEPEPALEEVREIAIPNPFVEEKKEILTPEKCSDFAIPGYDQSGRQIGWIKPERGANYFHPFSDVDCSNPTGRYDFSTGVITSLADGSKIGTDSDHIGYRNVRTRNLNVPQLSAPKTSATRAVNGEFSDDAIWDTGGTGSIKRLSDDWDVSIDTLALLGSSEPTESIISSRPYDRTFILRQFKPIPATIVSEVRADPSVYGCKSKAGGKDCNSNENYSIPVRATVDRNVYSDDGRTIILPTGTLLMGYLAGDLPGPYQAFGRMNIKWYQFIRPDGVEFNFKTDDQDPYSADAQGRMGVPGHGSTDYMEQMVMPILTAMVPAAVNLIAPITDTVINQIDLDNNTVVQSGTIRSSEMAKQDIINTWNKITQKLLVDAIDNTVPPFSIAAGTRINVFSPVDLIVTCGQDELAEGEKPTNKCAFVAYDDTNKRRKWSDIKKNNVTQTADDSSWIGQVRSFNLNQFCTQDSNGKITIDKNSDWSSSGYDYRTVLAYCEAQNYQAKNTAKQNAYNQNIMDQAKTKQETYGSTTWDKENGLQYVGNEEQTKAYNTEILGLTYDDEGNIENPFGSHAAAPFMEEETVTCDDGNAPDENGCCTGETYTDMGEAGFNCCPDAGGDCFPPIVVE